MHGRHIGAIVLIVLGVVFLLRNLGLADIRIFELLGTWWPLILIGLGVSILINRKPEK